VEHPLQGGVWGDELTGVGKVKSPAYEGEPPKSPPYEGGDLEGVWVFAHVSMGKAHEVGIPSPVCRMAFCVACSRGFKAAAMNYYSFSKDFGISNTIKLFKIPSALRRSSPRLVSYVLRNT
jgi:hypothetical protein